MRVIVEFNEACTFRIGIRTRERIALAKQAMKLIRLQLGKTLGLPFGHFMDRSSPPPIYGWRDGDWLVGYRRSIKRGKVHIEIISVVLET